VSEGEDLKAGWGEGGGTEGHKTAGPLPVPVWVFYKRWIRSLQSCLYSVVRAVTVVSTMSRRLALCKPSLQGACSGHKNHEINKILPFITMITKVIFLIRVR